MDRRLKGTSMMNVCKKIGAVALLVGMFGGAGGCAYAGLAATPDGTVYVARNDLLLFGLLRKLYACKPAEGGGSVSCMSVDAP